MLASFTTLALPVATCVLAAATLFLVGGVLVAQRTLRQTRTAAQLEAYVDLLREYRNPTLRLARARIYDLPKADPSRGLDQLFKAREREDVESVSHYLDTIGTLVGQGLLDLRPAALFLGGSATAMWKELSPYILAERQARNRPTYQRYFEDFVKSLESIPYEQEIAALRRMPDPNTPSLEIRVPPFYPRVIPRLPR